LAKPQANVAIVKLALQKIKTERLPKIATIEPVSGVAIAVARTLSVITQEI
jgi:hypothetical protein